MLSSANIRSALSLSKNLITDQTFAGFNKKLNTAGMAFDAAEGFGQAANNTSLIIVNLGGFNNQRITSDMKWVAPTLVAGYEIGCIARAQTFDTDSSYYYARCDGDVAKLTKVVAGVFTNLTRAGLNADNDIPKEAGVYIVPVAFDYSSTEYEVSFYFNKATVGNTFISANIKDTEGTTLWSE